MPESKSRKKAKPQEHAPQVAKVEQGNPRWLIPTMVGLMVLGLVWIVTTYVSGARYPIPDIGNLNLAIGFVLMFAGFALTLRWR